MYYGSRSIQINIGLDTRLQFVSTPSSPCNFIPVQRIAKKCAFCTLMLEVMPNIRENLFVASPICIKYTL